MTKGAGKAGPRAGEDIRIEYVSLAELERWPRNPKDHDIGALDQSLTRFGFIGAVLIDETSGRLVAGHGRLDALLIRQRSGMAAPRGIKVAEDGRAREWKVPVIRGIRFKDAQEAEAYLLADNQITMIGGWKEPELLEVLRDLAAREQLMGTGFDGDDVDALIRSLAADETPPAPAPGPAKAEAAQKRWRVKDGQVWGIPSATAPGKLHRVVCGDALEEATWTKLMRGDKAAMVFTDPPYGVNYLGDQPERKIANDALADDALAQFLARALKLAAKHARDEAAFYIWHATQTRRDFEWAMQRAGLEESQVIVWVKETFALGHADYHWQHEPCFYAHKVGHSAWFTKDRSQATVWRVTERGQGEAPDLAVPVAGGVKILTGTGAGLFITSRMPKKKKVRAIRPEPGQTLLLTGDSGETDVWQVARDPASEYVHPTQKPVALAERGIRNSSEIGQAVIDCFGGSGSTVVACEVAARVGRIIEQDVKFVAQHLERLEGMGLKPALRRE